MNKIKIGKYDSTVIPRYFADLALRVVGQLAHIFFSLILSVTFFFSAIFRVIS